MHVSAAIPIGLTTADSAFIGARLQIGGIMERWAVLRDAGSPADLGGEAGAAVLQAGLRSALRLASADRGAGPASLAASGRGRAADGGGEAGAAAHGEAAGGAGVLDPCAPADAALAVACLLALPAAEAEGALLAAAEAPGAPFPAARAALLLGLFAAALQARGGSDRLTL